MPLQLGVLRNWSRSADVYLFGVKNDPRIIHGSNADRAKWCAIDSCQSHGANGHRLQVATNAATLQPKMRSTVHPHAHDITLPHGRARSSSQLRCPTESDEDLTWRTSSSVRTEVSVNPPGSTPILLSLNVPQCPRRKRPP